MSVILIASGWATWVGSVAVPGYLGMESTRERVALGALSLFQCANGAKHAFWALQRFGDPVERLVQVHNVQRVSMRGKPG